MHKIKFVNKYYQCSREINLIFTQDKTSKSSTLPVGYGRLGSPGCQFSGAQIASDELIRCAYLISSSEDTGLLLAFSMESNFCLAWKFAVAYENKRHLIFNFFLLNRLCP